MSALAQANSVPCDLNDPHQVAAAWSGLIEPGDPTAGKLRNLLGSVDGLRWIFSTAPPPPEEIVGLSPEDRESIPWAKCHRRWQVRRRELDVPTDLRRIHSLGGRLLIPGEEGWPSGLADLEDREPVALWVAGDLETLTPDRGTVSMVGARASTSYGNRLAAEFAHELAEQNLLVLSGGAYGIDAAAHRGALGSAHHRSTGAILCGGLLNLYPRGNLPLFRDIRDRGVLVSEVPPHWRPARWRFLERNRLIAALADVVVIVEAGKRSGAIATANRALDLGRTVGAVPGPITSAVSAGCHQLIAEGASLIAEVSDIVEHLPAGRRPVARAEDAESPAVRGLSVLERRIWEAFPVSGQASAETLALAAGLSVEEVYQVIVGLQIRSMVDRQDGIWVRTSLVPVE